MILLVRPPGGVLIPALPHTAELGKCGAGLLTTITVNHPGLLRLRGGRQDHANCIRGLATGNFARFCLNAEILHDFP